MVEKAHEHEQEEQEETLATPGVIDKYKDAGKIANRIYLFKNLINTHSRTRKSN